MTSAPSGAFAHGGTRFDASAMRAVLAGDARPEIGNAEERKRESASGNPDALANFESLYERLQESGAQRIDGYVLFGSHVDALALFQASKERGYAVRISPTPRDARSSCGVALLIPCGEAARIHELARERAIPVENMVALPRQINAKRDKYC